MLITNCSKRFITTAFTICTLLLLTTSCKKEELPIDVSGTYTGTSRLVTSSNSATAEETNFPVTFNVISLSSDSIRIEPKQGAFNNTFLINEDQVYEDFQSDSVNYKAEFFPDESKLVVTTKNNLTAGPDGDFFVEYFFNGVKD